VIEVPQTESDRETEEHIDTVVESRRDNTENAEGTQRVQHEEPHEGKEGTKNRIVGFDRRHEEPQFDRTAVKKARVSLSIPFFILLLLVIGIRRTVFVPSQQDDCEENRMAAEKRIGARESLSQRNFQSLQDEGLVLERGELVTRIRRRQLRQKETHTSTKKSSGPHKSTSIEDQPTIQSRSEQQKKKR